MTFVIIGQAREGHLDEAADRGLGFEVTGGGESVQAVPGEFIRRDVGTERAL
jgi:hypothetical protein